MIWIFDIILTLMVFILTGTLVKINKEYNKLVDMYHKVEEEKEQTQRFRDLSENELANAYSNIANLEKQNDTLAKENKKLQTKLEKLQKQETQKEEKIPVKRTRKPRTKKAE